MKAFCAMAALGLSLMGSIAPASAQYGGRDYGGREDRYGDRDDGYRERGRGSRERGYGFDEGEYLRCNADVRRAVNRGKMESGAAHYRMYGRREGRRLSC